MANSNSQQLLELYQSGDDEAATQLYERYVGRLVALARTRVGARMQSRIDADDVVQSAFRSFYANASNNRYSLDKPGDLWRLLASITINKLKKQIQKHSAAKRNVAVEVGPREIRRACEPTPAEAAALVEELDLFTKRLTTDEKQALALRLQGAEVNSIATALGKSPRTIRRLLSQAKLQLEQQLLEVSAPEIQGAEVNSQPAPLLWADYLLQEMLGAGGMGKVFRALQRSTGATVAVKALRKSRQSDAQSVERFLQEATLLAQLDHANIVSVQGMGQFPSGGLFMVLEYVSGTDLEQVIARSSLSIHQATDILKQVAAGLSYAHKAGIAHCDLKPANVLLAGDGRVVVTDFGFANLLNCPNSQLDKSIGGTPGYMAPEVRYLGHRPTPAADIFALGALVAAMVPDAVHASLGAASPIDSQQTTIAAIVEKCTQEDPKRRYKTADEFLSALTAVD